MTLTAGSLFSGAGWLSLAVEQAMGPTCTPATGKTITRTFRDQEPAA